MVKFFLAPKAKDSPPLAAEQQWGIFAAPAVAALQVGQKPHFISLRFFLQYYYQASLSSLHGSHHFSYLNVLSILQ